MHYVRPALLRAPRGQFQNFKVLATWVKKSQGHFLGVSTSELVSRSQKKVRQNFFQKSGRPNRETAFQIVSYRNNFENLLLWLREFCKHKNYQQFYIFTRNDTGKIHELILKVIKIELLCNFLVLNYATTKLWSQPSYQQWSHEWWGHFSTA